ncbi:uncharacterized protein PG986_006217 [Apiospora aurea]|uniref:Uncharacterized protein n=1 Tax=Apiospora aurea TaxID=335848 RepID=A0ABR1QK00_9PEZI
MGSVAVHADTNISSKSLNEKAVGTDGDQHESLLEQLSSHLLLTLSDDEIAAINEGLASARVLGIHLGRRHADYGEEAELDSAVASLLDLTDEMGHVLLRRQTQGFLELECVPVGWGKALSSHLERHDLGEGFASIVFGLDSDGAQHPDSFSRQLSGFSFEIVLEPFAVQSMSEIISLQDRRHLGANCDWR